VAPTAFPIGARILILGVRVPGFPHPLNDVKRAVPLPDALIELLRERRKKYPTTRLIFPGEKKGSHLGSKQKSRKISRRRYSRHGRRSGISHLHGHTSDLSNNLP
jgi:integrase